MPIRTANDGGERDSVTLHEDVVFDPIFPRSVELAPADSVARGIFFCREKYFNLAAIRRPPLPVNPLQFVKFVQPSLPNPLEKPTAFPKLKPIMQCRRPQSAKLFPWQSVLDEDCPQDVNHCSKTS